MLYFKTKYSALSSCLCYTKKRDGEGNTIMWTELQTIDMTYKAITEGERPWNALGDFLNYWFAYAAEQREELVKEPIEEPAETTSEMHQWAVFCAASVEYLCERYSISCPQWVYNPIYSLTEPWFRGLGAHKPLIQAKLKLETPEPFARRNIYCSPHMFSNKYEVAADVRQRQTA